MLRPPFFPHRPSLDRAPTNAFGHSAHDIPDLNVQHRLTRGPPGNAWAVRAKPTEPAQTGRYVSVLKRRSRIVTWVLIACAMPTCSSTAPDCDLASAVTGTFAIASARGMID